MWLVGEASKEQIEKAVNLIIERIKQNQEICPFKDVCPSVLAMRNTEMLSYILEICDTNAYVKCANYSLQKEMIISRGINVE